MPLPLGRSRRPHLHAHSDQLGGEGGALVLSISGEEGRDSPKQGMGDAHLEVEHQSVRPNLIDVHSGEQEPCSCHHWGRHSGVK